MKTRIMTGILASAMTLVIPWVLLGMTATPKLQPEPVEEPEKQERRIQEIVIHECERESEDEQLILTVEIGGVTKELSLKEYLLGVLMGEMPGEFPLEALKAQAVAARTFTLRRMEQGGTLSDDPAVCQAYRDPGTAQEKWGQDWETYLFKMEEAVEATDGQVLTYEGELISATYFSCSGGRTEAAQAVWGGQVPYLVPVDSPGEENAGAYESRVSVPMEEFLSKLEIEEPGVSAVTYTEGGRCGYHDHRRENSGWDGASQAVWTEVHLVYHGDFGKIGRFRCAGLWPPGGHEPIWGQGHGGGRKKLRGDTDLVLHRGGAC